MNWPFENVNPIQDKPEAKSCVDSPFGCGHCSTKSRQVAVVSFVSSLLNSGCPSAVFGLVVAVVFDSLDSMESRRTLPHVSKEVLKAVFPSSAYFDTSAAVVVVTFDFFVIAAIFHRAPDAEFW